MAFGQNKINLTSSQRKKAQDVLAKYHVFSGGVWNLLGPYIITLLILHYNAGGFALGFISNAMQFTIMFGIVAPVLFAGKSFIKNKVFYWHLRSIACFLYILVVLIAGHFFEGEELNRIVVFSTCLIYFMFCVFRAFGMFSYFPVINASFNQSEQGRTLGRYVRSGNFGGIFSLILSFIVLKYSFFTDSKYTLLLLIFLGLITNFYSAKFWNKIPDVGTIPSISSKQIFIKIKHYLFDRNLRPVWITVYFANGMLVCIGFLTVYYKKIRGLDDSSVFLFTLFFSIAKMSVSLFSGKLSDIFGARPILFFVHLMISIMGGVFFILPSGSSLIYLGLSVFFVATLFSFSDILLSHIVHGNAPKDDVVNYFSTNTLVSAMSFLINGFLAGLVLQLETNYSHAFSYIWIAMSCFAILVVIMVIKGYKGQEQPISSVISAFSSLKNIKSVFAISALNEEDNPDKKATYLNQIATINEPYARNEIIRYLKSSNMLNRKNAYQAMRQDPFPEAYSTIFIEAKREDSFIRDEAIYLLRYYPTDDVIQFLRGLSKERNFYGLQAVLSLSQLLESGDDLLASHIKIWLETESIPQYRSRLLIALNRVVPINDSISNILNEAKKETSREYIRFLYINCLVKTKYDQFLEMAFVLEDDEERAGLDELLEHFSDQNLFKELKSRIYNENVFEMLDWIGSYLYKNGMLTTKYEFKDVVFPNTCLFFFLTLLYIFEKENSNNKSSEILLAREL